MPSVVDSHGGTRVSIWADPMYGPNSPGTGWVTRRDNMLLPASENDLKIGMLSPRYAMLFADGGPAKAAGLRPASVSVSSE